MILKKYQFDALEWFEKFLKRCRESGNPREDAGRST